MQAKPLRERALRIGKPTPLIGVSTEPEVFDPEKPVVLLLNSGVMHHVGACRLSVKIARAVAREGLLAVRYDYSGIGDSEPRRGSERFEEISIKECVEVMDYLGKTRGAKRFILYGLCSGADAAYSTALADERVVGIAQIDAYCYITWRYYWVYYAPLLFRWARWKSFLSRHVNAVLGRGSKRSPAQTAGIDDEFFEIPTYTRVFPPREEVAANLKRLVDRGVHMHVTFTGGEPHYNHVGQYRDSFPEVKFGDLLTVDYYPLTNHIITQPKYQQAVVDGIAGWIATQAKRYGEPLRKAG